MKPYKWGGRFYNNQHDSIWIRFKNFVKSFIFIVRNQVKIQSFNKKSLKNSFNLEHWIVKNVPPAKSLRPIITWIGHSTFLIQVNGLNILTDPIFGGGFPFFMRLVGAPIPIEKLPKIDVILISHNHKDHMHKQSLLAFKKDNPLILVPEKNGRWFSRNGFKRVVEKNWWEAEVVPVSTDISQVVFTFLPAIHWTSRGLFDVNRSLWGSWLIDAGDQQRIYFAGDSAFGDHFDLIARRVAPIDIALMPIAPNEPRSWLNDAHLSTDEAIKAFIILKAKFFIPMHWGTFLHMTGDVFDDPIKQLLRTWQHYEKVLLHARLHVVKFGELLYF